MENRSRMLTAAGILNIVAGAFGICLGVKVDPFGMYVFLCKLVIL